MLRGETAKLTKVDCYLDASKSTFDHVTYFAKIEKNNEEFVWPALVQFVPFTNLSRHSKRVAGAF